MKLKRYDWSGFRSRRSTNVLQFLNFQNKIKNLGSLCSFFPGKVGNDSIFYSRLHFLANHLLFLCCLCHSCFYFSGSERPGNVWIWAVHLKWIGSSDHFLPWTGHSMAHRTVVGSYVFFFSWHLSWNSSEILRFKLNFWYLSSIFGSAQRITIFNIFW